MADNIYHNLSDFNAALAGKIADLDIKKVDEIPAPNFIKKAIVNGENVDNLSFMREIKIDTYTARNITFMLPMYAVGQDKQNGQFIILASNYVCGIKADATIRLSTTANTLVIEFYNFTPIDAPVENSDVFTSIATLVDQYKYDTVVQISKGGKAYATTQINKDGKIDTTSQEEPQQQTREVNNFVLQLARVGGEIEKILKYYESKTNSTENTNMNEYNFVTFTKYKPIIETLFDIAFTEAVVKAAKSASELISSFTQRPILTDAFISDAVDKIFSSNNATAYIVDMSGLTALKNIMLPGHNIKDASKQTLKDALYGARISISLPLFVMSDTSLKIDMKSTNKIKSIEDYENSDIDETDSNLPDSKTNTKTKSDLPYYYKHVSVRDSEKKIRQDIENFNKQRVVNAVLSNLPKLFKVIFGALAAALIKNFSDLAHSTNAESVTTRYIYSVVSVANVNNILANTFMDLGKIKIRRQNTRTVKVSEQQ